MRRGFGLIGLVVTAIVLVIVGVIAYNIGWSDGVNTHLPAAGTAGAVAPPYYYYGYGPHWGGFGAFGAIFGLFWFLLIVFGLFWLFRIAFFGRRMWGGGWGGWGYGRGYGHGPGMPPGVDERMQDWHRRAHGEQPPAGATPPSGTTPPPPPPDQRSV
jgi:hypothetical protein